MNPSVGIVFTPGWLSLWSNHNVSQPTCRHGASSSGHFGTPVRFHALHFIQIRARFNATGPQIANLSFISSHQATLLKAQEAAELFHSDTAIHSGVVLLSYLCTYLLIVSTTRRYGINSTATSICELDSGMQVSLWLISGLCYVCFRDSCDLSVKA